jgi:hypothetical protein
MANRFPGRYQNNNFRYEPSLPWHNRIQNRRDFDRLLSMTGSYDALDELSADIYMSSIEDVLIPQEIRDNIDRMITRELNEVVDREFTRDGHRNYVPVNMSVDDVHHLMLRNNTNQPRAPDDFIAKLRRYIARTFHINFNQTAFVLNVADELKHYFEIYSNRREQEFNMANAGEIDRPRYNIMQFGINRTIDNRIVWHMLVNIPIFNARHITQLRNKVNALVAKVTEVGTAFNRTFRIDKLQFFLYQRPYSPKQVFGANTLLTLSASMISPKFYLDPSRNWNDWIQRLSDWFNINGPDIPEDEFRRQFNIEINVDPASYVRLDELYNMLESIYRNIGRITRSYIFVVDLELSSSLNKNVPSPDLERFRFVGQEEVGE